MIIDRPIYVGLSDPGLSATYLSVEETLALVQDLIYQIQREIKGIPDDFEPEAKL